MESGAKEQLDVRVDPATAKRQIWAAANLMREGGFNTLDTIDDLALLLFVRLAPATGFAAGASGKPKLEQDAIEHCLGSNEPIEYFRTRILPRLEADLGGHHLAGSGGDRQTELGLHIDDAALFRRLLRLVSAIPLATPDLNGLVYERLISTLSEAGHLGQYFTPRHVVDLMVALVDPQPGESIYDPACGTGGFFLGVTSRTESSSPTPVSVHGHEINRTVYRLCLMNLLIHGIDPSGIHRSDALGEPVTGSYDVVLSNPPFGGTVPSQVDPARFPFPGTGSEGLFLQQILRALRPGGRAAVVCPEGLLANLGQARALRRQFMKEARIDALISLPAGVFNPYTGVRTGILVFTKGTPTQRIRVFDVINDGFTQDARRHPVESSDLPRLLAAFADGGQTSNSMTVDHEILEANDDRLVASRYLHVGRGNQDRFSRVGELCDLIKSQVRPSQSPDELFTYLAMEHVEPRTGVVTWPSPCPGREIRSAKGRFEAGDLLYGKLRPYLAKVALVESPGICSTEFVVLRPNLEVVRPGYLAEILRSDAFTKAAMAMAVGANHPRVHPKDLLRMKVPLPSLAEQDEILASVTASRSQIERAKSDVARAEAEIAQLMASSWD